MTRIEVKDFFVQEVDKEYYFAFDVYGTPLYASVFRLSYADGGNDDSWVYTIERMSDGDLVASSENQSWNVLEDAMEECATACNDIARGPRFYGIEEDDDD